MEQQQLLDSLEEFVRQRKGEGVIVCTVIAVDTSEMLMTCEDGDSNEYVEVRLNATPGKTGVIAVPAVGASVLISDLGDLGQDYIMIHAGEIDQVYLYVDESTEVYVDDEQIRLGTGKVEPAVIGETLNGNLEALIDHLDTLVTALETFSTTQAGVSSGALAPLAAGYTTLTPQLAAVKSNLTAVNGQLDTHLSEIVKVAP